MFRRVCFLSLSFWLLGLVVFAQQPMLMPVKTGLPEQTRITLIYPAMDGYVYLGSGSSLYRFTGLNSEFIGELKGTNAVFTQFYSYNNELWLGCSDGAIYILRRDRLLKFNPEEGLPAVAITTFATDTLGRLWIGTNGEGVYCWDGKRLYQFGTDDGLPDAVVNSIYVTNSTIWVGTDGGLVALSFVNRQKKVDVYTTNNGLPDNIVTHIQGYKNQLVLGFHDAGLGVFADNTFIPWSDSPNKGAVAMHLAQDELYWVADDQSLYVYDFLHRQSRAVTLQLHDKKLRIQQLISDRNGTMWWLTSQGLFRHSLALKLLPLEVSGIQAVLADRQHRLWFSTREGLFMKKSGESPIRIHLGNVQANIISLYQDEAGIIWAGCFGTGIWRIHPASLKTKHYNASHGLENGNVFSIVQQNDSLLLGTLGGIYRAALGSANMAFYADRQKNGPESAYIFQLKTDRQQQLWIATDGNGLLRKTGDVYTHFQSTKPPTRTFTAITEDKSGNLWFSAPQQGLFRYDSAHLKHLPGSRLDIAALASLGDYVYAAYPQGIERIHIKTGQSFNWGKTQGLQLLEPYTNAIFQDKNEIWLGGQNELIRIRDIKLDQSGPRLVLKSININGQKHDSSHHQLAANDNQISFAFDTQWYEDAEAVHYRFLLEGYGQEWVNTRNQEITFPRLAPGRYTFKLEAAVQEHFEGATTLHWSFIIKPPFYQQWWFILFLASAFFGLVYGYVRTRDRRLKKQSRIMQEKVQAQFETLKSQVSPHFLFNSFNTLLALIESDSKKAAVYVEHLSDLFRNILKYRERDLITVNEEMELIQAYAYLQEQRFGENFKLEITIDDQVGQSLIPPLTLQLLLENAIKHNVITDDKPLIVRITHDKLHLIVTNPLQPKTNPEASTGFGLRSIGERYKLLTTQKILISEVDNFYQICLPLLYDL